MVMMTSDFSATSLAEAHGAAPAAANSATPAAKYRKPPACSPLQEVSCHGPAITPRPMNPILLDTVVFLSVSSLPLDFAHAPDPIEWRGDCIGPTGGAPRSPAYAARSAQSAHPASREKMGDMIPTAEAQLHNEPTAGPRTRGIGCDAVVDFEAGLPAKSAT